MKVKVPIYIVPKWDNCNMNTPKSFKPYHIWRLVKENGLYLKRNYWYKDKCIAMSIIPIEYKECNKHWVQEFVMLEKNIERRKTYSTILWWCMCSTYIPALLNGYFIPCEGVCSFIQAMYWVHQALFYNLYYSNLNISFFLTINKHILIPKEVWKEVIHPLQSSYAIDHRHSKWKQGSNWYLYSKCKDESETCWW